MSEDEREMAEVTVAAVKSLRDRTGAGMMDCKRALEESGGDEERAIDLLRQRGAAKAAKRSEKEVAEGVVQVEETASAVAMVELACETDFVARNDDFVAFAQKAAGAMARSELDEGDVLGAGPVLALEGGDLAAELNELRAAIGENLQLTRAVRWEPDAGHVAGHYVHFGNKIGVLVEVSGVQGREEDGRELATELAMHVAASDPVGLSADDIPDQVRERERKVLEEQARQEGKPDHIVEKIVEGRMRKFYEENALLQQPFVRDPDITVSELVEGQLPDGTVERFVRFEVGG